MGTLQLEKLWKYLQTLSLTDDNKECLANKLIESKGMSRVCEDETEYIKSSPEMMEIIKKGDEEIVKGNYSVVDPKKIWE